MWNSYLIIPSILEYEYAWLLKETRLEKLFHLVYTNLFKLDCERSSKINQAQVSTLASLAWVASAWHI